MPTECCGSAWWACLVWASGLCSSVQHSRVSPANEWLQPGWKDSGLCFRQLGSSAAASGAAPCQKTACWGSGAAPAQPLTRVRAPSQGSRQGFAACAVFTRVSYFPLRAEMGNSCRPGCQLVPTGTVTQSSESIRFWNTILITISVAASFFFQCLVLLRLLAWQLGAVSWHWRPGKPPCSLQWRVVYLNTAPSCWTLTLLIVWRENLRTRCGRRPQSPSIKQHPRRHGRLVQPPGSMLPLGTPRCRGRIWEFFWKLSAGTSRRLPLNLKYVQKCVARSAKDFQELSWRCCLKLAIFYFLKPFLGT